MPWEAHPALSPTDEFSDFENWDVSNVAETAGKIGSADYLNSIGAPELASWWRDPDFDPALPAFYYARVLEIPTPRWTTYDAAFFGSELPRDVPAAVQDRAYSSPVWYHPEES